MRDAMLFVAGRLDPTPGGPATDDLNMTRRSIYVQTARWDRSNFATIFDTSNPDASVENRNVSTVAPQALFLLNHDFVLSQAKHLADRVTRDEPKDEDARVQRLFHLVFARPATLDEMKISKQLLSRSRKSGVDSVWRDLAHVLLCSNEFVYLD
jgi:hypothetical protein